MCTLLCLAAKHLSFLRPWVPQYSLAALQLLTESARLFRRNLSDPITPQNCDALVGTSVLMQYLAWSNLDFLSPEEKEEGSSNKNKNSHDPDLSVRHDPHDTRHMMDSARSGAGGGGGRGAGLDMSRDELFLLSPGVRTLFFAAMPVLLSESSGSAFLSVVAHRPRWRIEQAVQQHLRRMGVDDSNHDDGLGRLVARFTSLWDDVRYVGGGGGGGGGVEVSRGFGRGSDPAVAAGDEHAISACQLAAAKDAFEYIARSVALVTLLCGGDDAALGLLRQGRLNDDMARYFFTFPVLASGPFLDLARVGDGRALVVLFHFYRAARVWLTADECWWASERSRVLERLIWRELESRGLEVVHLG